MRKHRLMWLAGLIHLVVASMSSIPIVKSVGTDNPSLTEKTAAFVWNTSYVVRDRAFWQFYGSDTLSVRTALGCMRTLAPNMIFYRTRYGIHIIFTEFSTFSLKIQ